jgi:hypothetical protein
MIAATNGQHIAVTAVTIVTNAPLASNGSAGKRHHHVVEFIVVMNENGAQIHRAQARAASLRSAPSRAAEQACASRLPARAHRGLSRPDCRSAEP